MFNAIVVEKDESGYRASLKAVDDQALPAGDVTVKVDYSTINYKDGLALTGKSPVVRKFPLHAGIDRLCWHRVGQQRRALQGGRRGVVERLWRG